MTHEELFTTKDTEWFLQGAELLRVRLDIQEAGLRVLSNAEIEEHAAYHCRFYGKKVKSMPKSASLTSSRWQHLRTIVRELSDDLRGLPKAQALRLIRTRASCSEEIMDNMTPDLRVWDESSAKKIESTNYGNEE